MEIESITFRFKLNKEGKKVKCKTPKVEKEGKKVVSKIKRTAKKDVKKAYKVFK